MQEIFEEIMSEKFPKLQTYQTTLPKILENKNQSKYEREGHLYYI